MHPSDYGMAIRDTGSRLQVTRVETRSAAALAGIQPGDEIVAVNGRRVSDALDLVLALSMARPGRVYDVEILRVTRPRRVSLITPQ